MTIAPPPLVDQLPVPCLRCGAAMRLVDDTRVRCDFCGHREALPADAADRVAVLRRRLASVRAAHQDLAAGDRRIIAMIEGGWLSGTLKAATGPLTIILLLVVLPALAVDPHADPAARVIAVGHALALLVRLLAVVGAMVTAWLLVARRYRRVVRPRLLARVPAAPGSPARCRACGGPLTVDREAFVACPYCGATNLLTAELTRERDRLLAAEQDEYRRRAAQADGFAREHARLASAGIFLGNTAGMIAGLVLADPIGQAIARALLA
jgi:DNA-directed RNA polymerase subunit RPC12/RpoP